MAKSVKSVIKGFKFETNFAKSVARKAADGKNSEVQVNILCEGLNSAYSANVNLITQVVELKEKLKTISIDYEDAKGKAKECDRAVNKAKNDAREAKYEVIRIKDTTDKLIESMQKDVKEAKAKSALNLSKVTTLLERIDTKDKHIVRLDNTIASLRNSRTKLDNALKIADDALKIADDKVKKYESNWFVKWFLK